MILSVETVENNGYPIFSLPGFLEDEELSKKIMEPLPKIFYTNQSIGFCIGRYFIKFPLLKKQEKAEEEEEEVKKDEEE